ncbi:MAG: SRPBCC family protein [Caulobacteraceae bacterium]|nr:SRPBCC family protein [Caulobacteraceae bacterium]
MATVHVESVIDRAPAEVWEVIGDWAHGPVRMAPGFVTSSVLDGEDRIVTFANGTVVKEIMTGRDDARRRLAWSVVENPRLTHHNGAFTCTTRATARPA